MKPANKRKSLLSGAILALIAAGASAPVIMEEFVREKESSGRVILQAYMDGARVWTICDGKTQGVTRNTVMTEQQCADWRKSEVGQRLAFARSVIKVPMSEPAWAGFGYFCYNVGNAGCGGSTAAKLINQGKQVEGCQAMLSWRFITRSMSYAEAEAYAKTTANPARVNGIISKAREERRESVPMKVDCSDSQPWCQGLWTSRQQQAELCSL